MQKRPQHHQDVVPNQDFSDSVGPDETNITQEQIRDVYFAGTSDGLVELDKNRTLNLKENHQAD